METSSRVSSDQIVSSFRRTTRITFSNERNVHLIRSNVFFFPFFFTELNASRFVDFIYGISKSKKKKKGNEIKNERGEKFTWKIFLH